MSQPRTVLLIDDDPLFRSLVFSILRRSFRVTTASDGEEAFYKALSEPPDVVVVDIHMPGWNGLRTLHAFQSHPSLERIPALILTSDEDDPALVRTLPAGGCDYLHKPRLTAALLLEKLAGLLDGAVSLRRGSLPGVRSDRRAPV